MHILIPATRYTREINITVGRNFYGEPAFSLSTHDSVRGHGDGLFIFAVNFRPWSLPDFIYYNATQRMDTAASVRSKLWRFI